MSTLVRGERPQLTGWENALRLAAAGLALVSAGFAAAYLLMSATDVSEFPFTTNSVAKDGLLAALCLILITDVRRWGHVAAGLIVLAHLLLAAGLLYTAWFGQTSVVDHTWTFSTPDTSTFRLIWTVADIAIALGFLGLNHMAVRSRYDLQYLTPAGFQALMAFAEILVLEEDHEITPAEVAKRVDVYLAGFRAHGKGKIRLLFVLLAYLPLLGFRAPLALMSPASRRRWVQRRFLDDVSFRRVPELVRIGYQVLIRTAQQFTFFGYYGDDRAAAKVDYLPFSQRPGAQAKIDKVGDPHRVGRVKCLAPSEVAGRQVSADVVIVGTGAGGAMLAHELARRGREVLMLERGAHIDPSEFTENEAEQLSNLYADGALTLSRDFRFRLAQGMCVGGSTVVNNAICFDLPDRVLDRWLDPTGLNAGLDPVRLHAAFVYVREFLRVRDVGPPPVLNPGALRILEGLGGSGSRQFQTIQADIDGCLGSGYCNLGCPFGKKLSALDWTLPIAQRDFPGAVRILADCTVEKVRMQGSRATGVAVRLADGTKLTINADTVVVSAGAVASSVILQRSDLGGERAGRGLAFNLGSPITLDFLGDPLHSERGLQMTHYLLQESGQPDDDGYAFETWYNPVVSQALFMPGWFEDHWNNMRRYANMTCLGVVIGSESNTSVKSSPLGGIDLNYTPTPRDFARIKSGVRLATQIALDAGAHRVLPSTFRMIEIHGEHELDRIDRWIKDDSDLNVNSSHPQAGNAMSLDAGKGVVGPNFRVHGTENVHVCDASVFPSSITVNPQLTVMALAAYAADEIAGPPPRPAPA